jgi:hypothetical protein
MNRAMQRRTSQALPARRLDPGLQQVLDAGFVERDDCVFLAAEARSACEAGVLDRTGREAFVNHVHVEDWSGPDLPDTVGLSG